MVIRFIKIIKKFLDVFFLKKDFFVEWFLIFFFICYILFKEIVMFFSKNFIRNMLICRFVVWYFICRILEFFIRDLNFKQDLILFKLVDFKWNFGFKKELYLIFLK